MFTLSSISYQLGCVKAEYPDINSFPIIVDLACLIIFGVLATLGKQGHLPAAVTKGMIAASIIQGALFLAILISSTTRACQGDS